MSETTLTLEQELSERIRRELPTYDVTSLPELVRILMALVTHLHPEEVFVFGSTARGEETQDSDVDLLVVVSESSESRLKRAQHAFLAVGSHSISLDIIVLTREEFSRRRGVPSSLPAAALREGKILYAA